MKTKREILEAFVTYSDCKHIKCEDCSYNINNNFDCKLQAGAKLSQIGAMALLRMFKKKKKPLLPVGAKIKFSDGKIATLRKIRPDYYRLDFGDYYKGTDYLIGKIWEIIIDENPCRTCEGKHFQHGCEGCKEVKNEN